MFNLISGQRNENLNTEIAFLTEKIGEISSLTPYPLDKAVEEIHFPICWGECKIVQYSSL